MNRETLLKILDLARWAPSGDNTQPWRFKIVSDSEVLIVGNDTQSWCLYDLNGWASQMAHGALLETIRIAASGFGISTVWSNVFERDGGNYLYRVVFDDNRNLLRDPLFINIEQRTVQRRSMSIRPINSSVQKGLADAVGENYRLIFFQSFSERLAVAKLLWSSAYVRLTCPEAYEVHREIIEWGARFSVDRIPEQAVGVDRLTALLMKWALKDWHRVDFLNRYLFGTLLPRIQLDFLPAIRCASHVLLVPVSPLEELSDFVNAGAAMQRLWLTATHMGLHLQPQMTPVIFRWYAQGGQKISERTKLNLLVKGVAQQLESLAGLSSDAPIAFFCRIGYSLVPQSRSIRRDLKELLIS